MTTCVAAMLGLVLAGAPASGSTGLRFAEPVAGHMFGAGKDYRVRSLPMAHGPGTWLQVGARVRVRRGSAGKIACIGYLSWQDAAGKSRSRSGFGNVQDLPAGQSGPWRVIEDTIRVPPGVAKACVDLSSRSFSGRVEVGAAWCFPLPAVGRLPSLTGPVVHARVPGWLGDYEPVPVPDKRVGLKLPPGAVVRSAPFRWDRQAGRVLRIRLGDTPTKADMHVVVHHYKDPTGRDIRREGIGSLRGGHRLLVRQGVGPCQGAEWARLLLVLGTQDTAAIATVEFTTAERMRREVERALEPVREALTNGGFESVDKRGRPEGWRGMFRPARLVEVTGRPGKRALVLATRGFDTEEVASDLFRVQPGVRLKITLSYRVDAMDGGLSALNPTIKWYQLPAERFALGGTYLANVSRLDPAQRARWIELRKTVTVPSTPRPVYYARIQLKNDRSHCRVLVDNVCVRVIQPPKP